jgi:hypothetical protein
MSNHRYFLGSIVAIFFVLGTNAPAFQTNNETNLFSAYAQTDSKTVLDTEKLLSDPQFRQQIIDTMTKNHDVAQSLITSMINDPTLRLQLLGHLTENKDTMRELMKMFGQNGNDVKIGSMMDHGNMPMKKEMKDSMKKKTMKETAKKDSMKIGSMMDHGNMPMKKEMKPMTKTSVDFSNIKVSDISANSVTVFGITDQAVNCQVEYWVSGNTKHYFASDTGDMMYMKHVDHEVTIKNLMPNTKYSYKFKATLDGKTFYSNEQTFTTAS